MAEHQVPEQVTKEVVDEFMQVFSKGDLHEILDRLTDDATWWVGGTIDGISGIKNKEEFGEMLGELSKLTRTGAIGLTPRAWTVQGDRAAVETESYAELHNGRVYNNRYHFVFTVRDGKISGIKEYLDTEHTRAVFVD